MEVKKVRAFTLVELMIGVVLITVLSTAAVGLFVRSFGVASKNDLLVETEELVQPALALMADSIRNAVRITDVDGQQCPASGSSLRLENFDGDLTIYTLSSDRRIASNSDEITSDKVVVNALIFDCVKQVGSPDKVNITIDAAHSLSQTEIRTFAREVVLRNY